MLVRRGDTRAVHLWIVELGARRALWDVGAAVATPVSVPLWLQSFVPVQAGIASLQQKAWVNVEEPSYSPHTFHTMIAG